jgi:hypothetical protein
MSEVPPKQWSTGKKVLVGTIAVLGTLQLVNLTLGTGYNLVKLAMR